VTELGYKYHMNDVTAAIGRAHLLELDDNNSYRNGIIAHYKSWLDSSIRMIVPSDAAIASGHLAVADFTMVLDKQRKLTRDIIIKELNDKNIFPGVHYIPNNRFAIFEKFNDSLYQTINADRLFENIMSLPCHLNITPENLHYIVESINNIINK